MWCRDSGSNQFRIAGTRQSVSPFFDNAVSFGLSELLVQLLQSISDYIVAFVSEEIVVLLEPRQFFCALAVFVFTSSICFASHCDTCLLY